MSVVFSTIEPERRSYPIAVGHSQMRHPVQCRAAYQQLRRLPVKRARTDSLAKDCLDPKDLRLSQASLVVVALTLPRGTPFLSDGAQVLIAQVTLNFRVAVLPDARSAARRDRRACAARTQCVVTVPTIVGSVSRHLLD